MQSMSAEEIKSVLRVLLERQAFRVFQEAVTTPPTAHPDIVHRVNIAKQLVAVLRDALTNSRRCLINRRNADQAATRVYPYAIFRISIAHHGFALHWIKLDDALIEVVGHQ